MENDFSHDAQGFSGEVVDHIETTVRWFMDAAKAVDPKEFQSRGSRFGVTLFEAIFVASCNLRDLGEAVPLNTQIVRTVKQDEQFQSHVQQKTTHTVNVIGRIKRVEQLMREIR